MPSFQTKALLVTPISGDNLRLIRPNCIGLVSHVCSDKAEFSFLQKKTAFDALSNVYQTDVWSVRYTRYHSHCTE